MNIPIDKKAPVHTRSYIEIEAPIDTVWNKLTNIPDWPSWQKAVTKTTLFGRIEEGTAFHWKAGGLSFKSKIHTSKLHKEFGWTGTTFGANAIHNWFFEQKDNKTIVKAEECLRGILPKLFSGYFQKNLDAGVITNLEELKAAAESV